MWNISADYVPDTGRYAVKQGIIRSNSRFDLVLGNPGFAIELKRDVPGEVCYREYWPDPSGDGDNSVHLRPGLTPEALAHYHLSRVPASHRILHHGGNEPALTPQLIAFSLAYAKEMIRLGGRSVLLNLSVGNPEKADWSIAKPLLEYVALHRNDLWIGLHEYSIPLLPYEFSGKDATQPHQWPAKVNGSSWLLGRYRELLYYCDRVGIARPNIAITELGWDYIHAAAAYQDTLPASGGCEKTGGMWCNQAVWGEWLRNTGMSMEEYAYHQIQWAWDAIYRHDPEVKGFAFFCYGHEGKWSRYDAALSPEFVRLMEQGNWSMSTTPTPPPSALAWPVTLAWGVPMRLRPSPSTGIAHTAVIPANTPVALETTNVQTNGGYVWMHVRFGGKPGYVALGVAP